MLCLSLQKTLTGEGTDGDSINANDLEGAGGGTFHSWAVLVRTKTRNNLNCFGHEDLSSPTTPHL